MKIIKLSTLVLICMYFLQACQMEQSIASNRLNKPKAISQAQAIQLAESFLITQGYTDQPTDIQLENVAFEPGEFASSIEKVLETRKDLLKLPAYGARQYGEFNKWAVAFEYINYVNNIGRGVSMDSLGNNIRLDPSELRIDWIDEWQAEQQKK